MTTTSEDDWRIGVCAAALAALCLGLSAPASAGEMQGKRQLGTPSMDMALGVATDGVGAVYLVGFTGGSLSAANRNSTDAWLIKLGAAGNVLWTRQSATRLADVALALAKDAADGVYIAGWTDGAFVAPPPRN